MMPAVMRLDYVLRSIDTILGSMVTVTTIKNAYVSAYNVR